MPTLLQAPLSKDEQTIIDKLVSERVGRPGALLGILEAAQERNPHNYLPLETLRYIALKTATPLSRIYSVATSMRCSTCSRREKTRSAYAAGRHAIRAARATCCKARGWTWVWGWRTAKVTGPKPTKWC